MDATTILDDTRYAMQYIVGSQIKSLYSFSLSDEVLSELTAIMKKYMAHYVHHEFKSLQVYNLVEINNF